MIDRDPFARASGSALQFVGDEKDAVLVADLAKTLNVSIRRNDQTVRYRDRFDDHRGDRVTTFKRDDLFGLFEALLRELRIAVAFAIEMAAIFVRIEETHRAGD